MTDEIERLRQLALAQTRDDDLNAADETLEAIRKAERPEPRVTARDWRRLWRGLWDGG